jgi:sugar/nucleoside kinase (ribokinase family)
MSTIDVAIAGELNLDMILYGLPEELPSERELLASGFAVTLGSSSAILAHNLASLGLRVSFAGKIGADVFGQAALQYLQAAGVDVSHVAETPDGTHTGVTVLLPYDTGRRILTYPGTTQSLTVSDLDIDSLALAGHFHLSSLFLQTGLHHELPDLLRQLRSRGLTISLDTNDDPSGRWDGILQQVLPLIDILLPNHDELCKIAKRGTVAEALDVLSSTVPMIVVKCGSDGALVQHRGSVTSVPAVPVHAIDTIGAGDSFNAGFLAAWLSALSPVESARAGNIAGALSTTQSGGVEAFCSKNERDAFLRKHGFPTVGSGGRGAEDPIKATRLRLVTAK